MSKGDMNPVMYGILKMVEYKVQIITFPQIFHDFYKCLSSQLCKMHKSFNPIWTGGGGGKRAPGGFIYLENGLTDLHQTL